MTAASDNFYLSLEDKFRGSTDLIRSRLSVYLPYLEQLSGAGDGTLKVVDLGSGRGEFLKLLEKQGYDAVGVDLNETFVRSVRRRGLSAELEDVRVWLEARPESSLDCITAIHVVEHVGLDDLHQLVRAAHRVLSPGGLLIMETPNPENILVTGHTFFLDPTHTKPIPPLLLDFLCEDAGFVRTSTLRLNTPEEGDHEQSVLDRLASVSPDYAIIAQKGGSRARLVALKESFETEVGKSLTTSALARPIADVAYVDKVADAVFGRIKTSSGELSAIAAGLREDLHGVRLSADNAHEKLDELNAAAERTRQDARVKTNKDLEAIARVGAEREERLQAKLREAAHVSENRFRHQDEQIALLIERMETLTEDLSKTRAESRRALDEKVRLETSHAKRVQAISSELSNSRAQLQSEIAGLQDQLAARAAHEAHLRVVLEGRERNLRALQSSTSWRLTRPLRVLVRLLRSPLQEVRRIAHAVDHRTRYNPSLRRTLVKSAGLVGVTRDVVGTAPAAPVPALVPTSGNSFWSAQPPAHAVREWKQRLKTKS